LQPNNKDGLGIIGAGIAFTLCYDVLVVIRIRVRVHDGFLHVTNRLTSSVVAIREICSIEPSKPSMFFGRQALRVRLTSGGSVPLLAIPAYEIAELKRLLADWDERS